MRNCEEALQTSPLLLPHCCSSLWQSRNRSWLPGSRGAVLAAVSPHLPMCPLQPPQCLLCFSPHHQFQPSIACFACTRCLHLRLGAPWTCLWFLGQPALSFPSPEAHLRGEARLLPA